MAAPDVKKLLELDVETRLALAQQLWDSIVDDPGNASRLPLDATDKAVLDERLDDDDRDPSAAIPWAEAKNRLRRG
jgi:putative addiction module component (TIGR02574 family)